MRSRQNSLIGAVVLAAGKSTRMGEPKQLLPWNGRPLLEHTLGNLRNLELNEIVVVLGCGADAVRKRVDLDHLKVVENKNYEQGLGNSLGVGVSALAEATEAVFIALADQPFVRSETYEQLIDHYRWYDAQIVIPTYRGFRGNPVLLDRSVFPEVMALNGDVGCRAIFGDHSDGITKVAVDDIGILLDIDTKDDFANLRKYRAGVEAIDHQFDEVDVSNRTLLENDASSHAKNKLVLVGSEPVVVALAKMARILQFRVTLLDPLLRASDLPAAHEVLNSLDLSHIPKGPDCYMVIASRGRFDEEAIEQALEADVGYIALVANRKRAAELRRRLEEKGQAPKKLARLRSPAGLDIGANTAEEIALSILAEIVYVSRKVGEDRSL